MLNPFSIFRRSVLYVRNILWVRLNPVNYGRRLGVRIGEGCHFLGASEPMFGSEPYLIKIGNNVTLSRGCDFITHDGGVRQFRKIQPDIDVMGTVVIDDDVFVGPNVVFLPDTHLGERCVVGAGSVVKGHFPADSYIAGNPARRTGSVQEYLDRVQKQLVPTSHMNSNEKRVFLENLFWHKGKSHVSDAAHAQDATSSGDRLPNAKAQS